MRSKMSTWGRGIFAILCLSWCLFEQTATAREIYRWQDERGNPVISDRPPPSGTPYTTLNPYQPRLLQGSAQEPGTTQSRSPSGNLPNTAQTGVARAVQDRPKSSTNTSNAKTVNADQCVKARDALRVLETFPKILVQNQDNGDGYLSDTERSERIELARERITRFC